MADFATKSDIGQTGSEFIKVSEAKAATGYDQDLIKKYLTDNTNLNDDSFITKDYLRKKDDDLWEYKIIILYKKSGKTTYSKTEIDFQFNPYSQYKRSTRNEVDDLNLTSPNITYLYHFGEGNTDELHPRVLVLFYNKPYLLELNSKMSNSMSKAINLDGFKAYIINSSKLLNRSYYTSVYLTVLNNDRKSTAKGTVFNQSQVLINNSSSNLGIISMASESYQGNIISAIENNSAFSLNKYTQPGENNTYSINNIFPSFDLTAIKLYSNKATRLGLSGGTNILPVTIEGLDYNSELHSKTLNYGAFSTIIVHSNQVNEICEVIVTQSNYTYSLDLHSKHYIPYLKSPQIVFSNKEGKVLIFGICDTNLMILTLDLNTEDTIINTVIEFNYYMPELSELSNFTVIQN